MMRLVRILALCLLLTANTSFAIKISGLDSAQVPVASRHHKDFHAALVAAYERVLVKRSGNPTVMTLPQIQNNLARLNDYLLSYAYQQRVDSQTQRAKLFLNVVFDGSVIKQQLEQAGQTLWGADRPLTLVIIASRSGMPWQVDGEKLRLAQETIAQYAEDYGLKVIFPALDLQDQQVFAELNGLGLSEKQLLDLFERYHVQAILYAAVDLGSAWCAIDWRLSLSGKSFQWPTHAATETQALTQGMQRLLERYANEYATLSSHRLQTSVLLKVSGVSSLSDYTKMLAALNRLSVVKGVTVRDMSGSEVLLQVAVLGGTAGFQQAAQGTQFVPDLAADSDALAARLYYHWATKK